MVHDNAPPPQFLEAAQKFALSAGLDAGMVAQGRTLLLNGVRFWLRHGGDEDPTALLLMVEVGPLPAGGEAKACRRLLELHYQRSHPSGGTYCVLPGTSIVACSLRLDLAVDSDRAQTIIDFVEQMAVLQQQAVSTLERK